MDDTLTTNAEPQVVETDTSAVSNAVPQDTNLNTGTDINDGSQVVEQPTPMDDNVTYNNIPVEPAINSDRDLLQNTIENAIHIDHDENQNINAGVAMDNFLNNEYDYDKNEAGTYWVAGAINDVDTQMSFLNTLINEEMYDEMDLQKYYYDTTMATARAYAAQKKKETAYGFYRAAQEKAIAEAELTGWYMPAEGNYMLGQYTVAQNVLEDPNAPDDARARAQRISGTVEKWFAANQIGTRGIKCLNMMNYEENVRHNTIMGELQKEANKIAASGAAASAAAADLQLRELKFQVEELELQYGFNFTRDIGLSNDEFLGHDVANDPDYIKYQALGGAKNLEGLLKNPKYFAAILGARNSQWIENSLGEETYTKLYDNYRADLGNTALQESIKNNGNVLDESYLNKQTYKVSATDKEYGKYKDKNIYTFDMTENNQSVTKCYVKDNNGIYHQIENANIALQDGKKLSDKVHNFSNSEIIKDNNIIQVGSKASTGIQEASMTNNWKNYESLNDNGKKNDHAKKIEEYEEKGYIRLTSKHGDSGLFDIDSGTVMYNPDEDKYITISDILNKVETKKKSDIKEIDQPNWTAGKTFYEDGSSKYAYMIQNSELIGETTYTDKYGKKHATNAYLFVDGDGNGHVFMRGEKGSTDVLTNTYTVLSDKEAAKISKDIDKKVDAMNNYRANIKYTEVKTKAGENADTKEQKTRADNSKKTLPSGKGSGGGGTVNKSGYDAQDTVEKRNAVFNKYNVDPIDQQLYANIQDPEKLEEKLKERYEGILGMGGNQ